MRVTSLRFLLSALVVVIHNNFNAAHNAELLAGERLANDFVFHSSAFSKWLQFFISDGLGQAAVPVFFIISAYLQFKKNDFYGKLLKKKTKSLSVPYFLWWALQTLIITLAMFTPLAKVPALGNYPSYVFRSGLPTASQLIESLFGRFSFTLARGLSIAHDGALFMPQMWFVRDLFIMIVFSPVLKKALKKFPLETFFLALFFYLANISVVADYKALFFYTAGAFCAYYDVDFFALSDRLRYRALVPLFIIFAVLKYTRPDLSIASQAVALCAAAITLKFSKNICSNQKAFGAARRLSVYSFFLYAIHAPLVIGGLKQAWIKVLPMKNTFFVLAEYFGVSMLTIAIGTLCGALVKKFSPAFFALLNGGR